jgi:hypothetical protein
MKEHARTCVFLKWIHNARNPKNPTEDIRKQKKERKTISSANRHSRLAPYPNFASPFAAETRLFLQPISDLYNTYT